MRSVIQLCLTLALLCVMTAFAHDGQEISLVAGETSRQNVPISLTWDSESPDGVVTVLQRTTGNRYPATVRNGELVFITEGAVPGAEHLYVVEITEEPDDYVPKVVIEARDEGAVLAVIIEDKHFTSFHVKHEFNKPFLWPVKGEGDISITRDWPMIESDRATDHVHQTSMWTAHGEYDNGNTWHMGPGAGEQRINDISYGSGDAYGWIALELSWLDADGAPKFDETREYRFYASPVNARLMDTHIVLHMNHGSVTLRDTKEAGMKAVRMHPDISDNAVITNAHGDVGESNLWGKPSPWCDYSANLEVGWRGLAIFDHPDNPRHPTSWHVRNYGLMAANCFGYHDFKDAPHNEGLLPMEQGDMPLEAGETITFNYRVYVHSGDVEAAKVADRYADYATPPQVDWVD